MPENQPLSREAFNSIAAGAGIDVTGDHGEELYNIVQGTLSSLASLKDIEVQGAEPDMAFLPNGTPGGSN